MGDCEFCRSHVRAKTVSPKVSRRAYNQPLTVNPQSCVAVDPSYNLAQPMMPSLQQFLASGKMISPQQQSALGLIHSQGYQKNCQAIGSPKHQSDKPPPVHRKKTGHGATRRRYQHYSSSSFNKHKTIDHLAVYQSSHYNHLENTMNLLPAYPSFSAPYQQPSSTLRDYTHFAGRAMTGTTQLNCAYDDIYLHSNGIVNGAGIPTQDCVSPKLPSIPYPSKSSPFTSTAVNGPLGAPQDTGLLDPANNWPTALLTSVVRPMSPVPMGSPTATQLLEERFFDDTLLNYPTSSPKLVEEHFSEPVPHYGNQQQVIEERLTMYNAALQKSHMASDQSKVRRYTRQIKTLEDQRKMIKAGKLVKDEDIPGPITMMVPQSASAENNQCGSAGVAGDEVNNVSAGTTRTVPSSASGSEHSPTADMLQASSANPAQSSGGQQQSSVDQTPQGAIKRNQRDSSSGNQMEGNANSGEVGVGMTSSESTLAMLNRRVNEYKVAAQLANKQGDKPSALNYVRVIKGFQEVITAVESGRQVDVSNLPGPPPITNGSNSSAAAMSGQQISGDNSSIGSNNSDNFNSPAHQLIGAGGVQMSRPNITPSHQQNLSTAPSSSSTSSANNVPCSPTPQYIAPVDYPHPQTSAGGAGGSTQTGGDENLEALIVRMNVFKEASEKAKQSGQNSKVRRLDRLKNQYMDAIRAYKANRLVAWDNLTNPYGYPPLPNTDAAAAAASNSAQGVAADYDPIASLLNAAVEQIHATSAGPDSVANNAESGFGQQVDSAADSSLSEAGPHPHVSSIKSSSQHPRTNTSASASGAAGPNAAASSKAATSSRPPPVPPNHPSAPNASSNNTAGKQITNAALPNKIQMTVDFLEKRQQQYRAAAIASKKRNEIEEAKRYLRLCKGFDPMIAAAKLGKPVDLAQVPPALTGIPKVGAGAAVCNTAGGGAGGGGATLIVPVEQPCAPKHNADPKEVASLFQSIEQQLQLQINKCRYDSEYYASIGEITNVNRAEKMLQCSMVDLNVVQACRLRGELPPKMHYEQRAFTKIRVNSDLNEGECEVLISRAINLPCPDGAKPSDMSTYAKWSFPWPSESSTSGQTGLVKNSDKPVFNFKQKIPISDRKERMSRQVRRKTLDVTIYAKGGIFKSDKALGIALVKLDSLDKKCTLHEVVQLMDPVHTRSKTTCGKVEVSVRIREPFVSKDTEEVVEKWLVVDAEPTAPIQPQVTVPSNPGTLKTTHGTASSSGVGEKSAEQSTSADKSSKTHQNSTELKPPGDGSPIKSPKTRKKSPRPPPRNPPAPAAEK